jgi:hypothetical protein
MQWKISLARNDFGRVVGKQETRNAVPMTSVLPVIQLK